MRQQRSIATADEFLMKFPFAMVAAGPRPWWVGGGNLQRHLLTVPAAAEVGSTVMQIPHTPV